MNESTINNIRNNLTRLPKLWDGKNAIQEMKNDSYSQWRQMEWIGFYFQFLCGKNLADIMQMPGKKYGNVAFDGFLEVPWDFKAHAMNTSNHRIIVNDKRAIENAIKQYNEIGLILALGGVVYNDRDRTFQKWHEVLKGGKSQYEFEREQRGAWSRLRKVEFNLEQIIILSITTDTLQKSGSFQDNFRNADGSPRKSKILLDLEKIENEIVQTIEF